MALAAKYEEAKDVAYYLEERYHEVKVGVVVVVIVVRRFGSSNISAARDPTPIFGATRLERASSNRFLPNVFLPLIP